jgi:hypothetical protein
MMTCEQAKAGSDDSEEARECQRGRPVGVYSCVRYYATSSIDLTASMDTTQTDFDQALEMACRDVDHKAIS